MKARIIIIAFIVLGGSYLFYAQSQNKKIPITAVKTGEQFSKIAAKIKTQDSTLYVFDIDNTLLITNENKFGSDWWYSQSSKDPSLRLNVSDSCLYDVLTPLFYSIYSTTAVFGKQPDDVNSLANTLSKTMALTSRAYTPIIAKATELELQKNNFNFLVQDSATLNAKKDIILLNSVIYTKGGNKGKVLLAYAKANKQYNKFYFFDDSIDKVEDVQAAFDGEGFDISLFHYEIAPKILFTEDQKTYMKTKLCDLIENLQELGNSACTCNEDQSQPLNE